VKSLRGNQNSGCTKRESGQVFIEYILLLLVAFSLAALIIRQVVSLNPDDPGFLVSKWQAILEQIASDDPNR
jgi:sensor histidine kinase regulating citrate/malate metabolism